MGSPNSSFEPESLTMASSAGSADPLLRAPRASLVKRFAKIILPTWLWGLLRFPSRPNDRPAIANFLLHRDLRLSLIARVRLLVRMSWISINVPCAHTEEEMLEVLSAIFSFPTDRPGAIVEAGCFKGGSAAKFSLGAALSGRPLYLFDSFVGIPDIRELDENGKFPFPPGSWAGSEEEVRWNVAHYGEISACVFHRGWFEETLKDFHQPIAVAYLDVDLAASTRTCLKYIYPKMAEGGTLFSQDGHLPLVQAVFADPRFWHQVVGCGMPTIEGLGTRKLIRIVKTAATLPHKSGLSTFGSSPRPRLIDG